MNWRLEHKLRLFLIGILGLSALAFLSHEAQGDMDITEEWVIQEGATEVVENETLNLYRNVRVYGQLELYNSTLINHEPGIGFLVGSHGVLIIHDAILNSIYDSYQYHPNLQLNDTAKVSLDGIRLFTTGFKISSNSPGAYPSAYLNDMRTEVAGSSGYYPSYISLTDLNFTLTNLESHESVLYVRDSLGRIEDSVIRDSTQYGLQIWYSEVDLNNVSLYGNGFYGLLAHNSTVTQNEVSYLDPQGENPNALGRYIYEMEVPVRIHFNGQRIGARGNLTTASGALSSIEVFPAPDEFILVTDRVGNTGPEELFPYTLRLKPLYEDYIVNLPDAQLTYQLDEIPAGLLDLVIMGELELDLEIVDLELPPRIYELEDTEVFVTIRNLGTATLRDLPVTIEVTNSSSTTGKTYYGYEVGSHIVGPGEEATYGFTFYLPRGPHHLNISLGDTDLARMGVETIWVGYDITVYTQIDKYKAQEEETTHPVVYFLLVLLALAGCLGVYYQYRHILAVDEQKMRRFEDDPPRTVTETTGKPRAKDHSYRPAKRDLKKGLKGTDSTAGSDRVSEEPSTEEDATLFECPRCQGEVRVTDIDAPVRCPSCGMTGETEAPEELEGPKEPKDPDLADEN